MSTRWLVVAVAFFACSLVPTTGLILLRTRIGPLTAAAWSVVWGTVIVTANMHSGRCPWRRETAAPHARVHYFMAGTYALVGGVVLCVVAQTLLSRGRRTGWFAVLFALVVGGGLEILVNGPTGLLFQHGLSVEESRPEGTFLFGYLVAWLAALLMAYRPIFSPVLPRPSADLEPTPIS